MADVNGRRRKAAAQMERRTALVHWYSISRIGARSGNLYQSYDVLEKVGEEEHRARFTEEVEEFSEIGISETSYFQSRMHFDGSVESIADSDLQDGELQKMLTSPLYAQKALGKINAMVLQEHKTLKPIERKV